MPGLRRCEPIVRETRIGYLATTPLDHSHRIGAAGGIAEEAIRRFWIAFEAWEELHERAQAEA